MFPIQNGVATRYAPVVTWCLIASNCAIFLFQISLGPTEQEWLLLRFALIPARDFNASGWMGPADYLPFVTNMFLHGGWLHLILNMWSLWIFGAAVEDRLGALPYLVFYLATGIAASFAHAFFNPLSDVPALGASGAIAIAGSPPGARCGRTGSTSRSEHAGGSAFAKGWSGTTPTCAEPFARADSLWRCRSRTPLLSGPDRVRWGTSFHNWIKTWYAPLLFATLPARRAAAIRRPRHVLPPRRFPGRRRLRPHVAGHGGGGVVHPLPPAPANGVSPSSRQPRGSATDI